MRKIFIDKNLLLTSLVCCCLLIAGCKEKHADSIDVTVDRPGGGSESFRLNKSSLMIVDGGAFQYVIRVSKFGEANASLDVTKTSFTFDSSSQSFNIKKENSEAPELALNKSYDGMDGIKLTFVKTNMAVENKKGTGEGGWCPEGSPCCRSTCDVRICCYPADKTCPLCDCEPDTPCPPKDPCPKPKDYLDLFAPDLGGAEVKTN